MSIAAFRRLHASGCFVMPNAWDAGSAAMLQHLGFPAIASTSSGYAWSLARRDNEVGLGPVLAHLRALVEAVDVPINADFEGGFAVDPEDVAVHVGLGAATGVAGLSIEDSTGDATAPLFDFQLSVERIAAARAAIDAPGTGVLLTGRSEGFIVGRPDIDETIRRLRAYSEAGADCLYAPGIRTPEHIRAVIDAVAPKPVNVLVSADFTTVHQLADAGVRRISVGGALARVAWAAFIAAAREINASGTFAALESAVTSSVIEESFRG
jgi:2-methylisocitrate lyase-like PEP mutase family enzyme